MLFEILAAALITGQVLTDTGTPIAGVSVSDGVTIAQTDETGAYEMPYRENAEFVFVSVPSGYDIPLDATGSPLIYQRVSEAGQYDFTLHPQADGGKADSSHVMLVFSDPQVLNGYDENRFRTETVEDVLRLKATYPAGTKFYGICVGDIVWDWYDAFSKQKKHFEAMGFPSFMVIGNHDHNCQAAKQEDASKQDSIADDKFTKVFGPTYYSFNIGSIHYVVLDNVLYTGSKGTKDYTCGLTAEQQNWLQQDLALQPNGTPIVVSFHIPSKSMTGVLNSLKSWMNKGAVMQHLLSGHTHVNTVNEISARLQERTMGAAEGAFWASHWCSDGSPNGYMVYETNAKKGFNTWYYKATGYSKDYQMATFPVNSIDAGNDKTNCVLANVWSYDSKSQVNIYEDGVKGIMRQFTGIDPRVYDVLLNEGDTRPNYPGSDGGTIASKNPGAGATNHMFYYEPQNPNADFEVEFIDRFGNVSRQKVLKNMMVATFAESADGNWQYLQNFDQLCAYPNHHSETRAKGTFVQGHYPEGWYACTSGNKLPDGISDVTWETFNWYHIGEGSHKESGLYNFGAGNPAMKSQNSEHRSLGSLTDGSNQNIQYGVLIENNTGAKIKGLNVAYTGKVWRSGSKASAVDTLSFSYVLLSNSGIVRDLRDRKKYLGDIRTRALHELDFVTPSTMTTVSADVVKVDGDNKLNQSSLSATIKIDILPGEVVLLKWSDLDEDKDDQALAIDDLVVTAELESTGVSGVTSDKGVYTRKVLQNGHILIIRNGIHYDMMGNLIQ